MLNPAAVFSSIFSSVRVPPPLHDPTGGLLEPVLSPINFVISHIEDAILGTFTEGTVMLRAVLLEATNGLNQTVDQVIVSITNKIQNGVQTFTTTIQGIANDMTTEADALLNDLFGMVNRVEAVLANALTSISQFALSVLTTINNGIGDVSAEIAELSRNTRARISTNIASGFNDALQKFQQAIDQLRQRTLSSMNAVTSSVDTVVVESAKEIDKIGSRCLSDGRDAIGKLSSGANDAVSFARDVKQRAGTTIGSVKSRLVKVRSSINIPSAVEGAGSKMDSALQTTTVTRTIALVVGVVVLAAVVYLMYKMYVILLRPAVRELVHEIEQSPDHSFRPAV